MHAIPAPLRAPIARHAVWPVRTLADGAPEAPDVGFVEPMLRRRLSSLARMTLCVAQACTADHAHERGRLRLVYASRHGELARTTTMLEALAARQELSPTVFSTSVLNASAGLFSILHKNRAPATASPRASFRR